jgi:hypothetical protein
MRVITPGHEYELKNKINGHQTLIFYKDLPKNIIGHDGVLCQEVIRVLIDRYLELYK